MRAFVKWQLAIVLAMLVLPTLALAQDDKAQTVYPVAILPFSERGREVADMGNKVTDLLFANLIANPELYLVDREDLKKVLEEQELNLSGVVNPSQATKVGQLTGAKIIVTGSVLQVDNSLYLIAKIIGTETSRVVGTSAKGNVRDELGALAETLAAEVGKTILKRSDELVAKPATREDRVAALKKKLGKSKLPNVQIKIPERHIGQATIDPAAETEITLFCTESGFTVIDPDEGDKKDVDVMITGEAFSEFATRRGNLISVKARIEVKAVDRQSGEIVAIDRQTCVAVGLTEQVAAKSALQEAGAAVAERLLPKLATPEKDKKKRKR